MRDRLIELLRINNCCIDFDCDKCMTTKLHCFPHNVADHLLASGVILPPCKVGDTVYAYCEEFGTVLPYFVENLRIGFMDKERNYWVYEANCHAEEMDVLLDEIDFDLDDLGKTVFFTEKEAIFGANLKGENDDS